MKNRHLLPSLALALTCTGALVMAQSAGNRASGQPPRGGFSPDRLLESDADGDGRLSRDELPQRLADRMFDQADTNKDGYLDKKEIEAFFESRGAGRRGGQGRGAAGGGDADFESQMRTLGRSMRRLSRSGFDSGTRESDLVLVSAIQGALVRAKATLATVKPAEQAMERYGNDKAAYHTSFRLGLLSALGESVTLEKAILNGDADAARASVKTLVKLRDNGHDAFQGHDEDEDEKPAEGQTGSGR